MQSEVSQEEARGTAAEPIVRVTDKAIEMAKVAIAREGGEGLRIGVVGGGCSGMSYHMAVESEPRSGDSILELGGVRIFIDAESQPHLAGVTVDYVTGLHGAGFKFQNPNASRTCGCGSSFSTS